MKEKNNKTINSPHSKGRPASTWQSSQGWQRGVMRKLFNSRTTLSRRKQLRNEMPLAEVILWSKLKSKQLNGAKFRRQHSIGKYIVDFYCPAKNLVIEVDGDSHYLGNDSRNYDRSRSKYIKSLGLVEIRFNNSDVYNNIDGVIQKIATTPAPPSKGGDWNKSQTDESPLQ